MKNIIFLAVQGAGKGTFAKKLKEKYGYAHISTGDILRERASVDDELGNKIKNLIDNGIFVPNDIIFKMLKNELIYIQNQHCVFDGYPRTLQQAKELAKIIDVDAVIFVEVPDNVLIDRVLSRKSCVKCGTVADILKVQKVCPKCGGEFATRADDNVEVVKNRLDIYNQQTAPLIEYYSNKIISLDNSGEWENTKIKLKQIIKNLLKTVDNYDL